MSYSRPVETFIDFLVTGDGKIIVAYEDSSLLEFSGEILSNKFQLSDAPLVAVGIEKELGLLVAAFEKKVQVFDYNESLMTVTKIDIEGVVAVMFC